MIVDVSIDFFVDVQIYGTGRFPAALLKEIGLKKVDIYKNLKPDPDDPDMLRGSAAITVKGRRFDVLFAADKQQIDLDSDIYPMRVVNVDELSDKRK